MFFNYIIRTKLQNYLTETETFCVLTFYATSEIEVLAWNASMLLKSICLTTCSRAALSVGSFEQNMGCRSFSDFKTLTGCRSFSQSEDFNCIL